MYAMHVDSLEMVVFELSHFFVIPLLVRTLKGQGDAIDQRFFAFRRQGRNTVSSLAKAKLAWSNMVETCSNWSAPHGLCTHMVA
jgi:hypothetical protein